jgi:hypothetical protein
LMVTALAMFESLKKNGGAPARPVRVWSAN